MITMFINHFTQIFDHRVRLVWISFDIIDDILQSVGKIGQSAGIYVANQVVFFVPIIWNLLIPDVFSISFQSIQKNGTQGLFPECVISLLHHEKKNRFDIVTGDLVVLLPLLHFLKPISLNFLPKHDLR
jgi:hypothetical protein